MEKSSKAGKSANNLVTAKRLAAVTKESYSTIDHWSGEGLLIYRRVGSRRMYDLEENVRRCNRIRELQAEELSLKLIKKELSNKET
jgi:DNA-binding transcriptional MerR regulator